MVQPNTLLKNARRKHGLTQEDLAEQLNVDARTISNWEQGKHAPQLEFRKRLSEILGASPEELGVPLLEEEGELLPGQQDREEGTAPVSLVVLSAEESEDTHAQVMPSFPAFPDHREALPYAYEDVNRQRMLTRVHEKWIKGLFEDSLYHSFLLILELSEQPDVLENPWQEAMQETLLPSRTLPLGTRITQLYDAADGELLILGEPGAGKTTLILELTRTLIQRARSYNQHPIPIYFNLLSWVAKRQPFHVWLIEEIVARYRVPLKVARDWMDAGSVILLLDGLDDVGIENISSCIEAINAYRREHGFVSLVVCCRYEDYITQPARFILNKAITVKPLSIEQIDEFIAQSGADLAALRLALEYDGVLQELASTPLMLNILAVTYTGVEQEAPLVVGEPQMRRSIIFERYVNRVLEERGPKKEYRPVDTKRYLAFLASQMQQHRQVEFYLERIQPDWLPESEQRHYQNMVIRVVVGIEIFVCASLLALFRDDALPSQPGLFSWLGGGEGISLLGWMAPGLGGGFQGFVTLQIVVGLVMMLLALLGRSGIPSVSWKSIGRGLFHGVRHGLLVGSIVGLCSGGIFALDGGIGYGFYRGLGTGAYCGVLTAFVSGLITLFGVPAQPMHGADPPLKKVSLLQKLKDRLLNTLLFTGCAGVGAGLIYAWEYRTVNALVVSYALILGIFYGLVFGSGLGLGLFPELGVRILPAEVVRWSGTWRQFRHHAKKGVLLGIGIMFPTVLALAGISGSFYGLEYGVRFGLIYGAILGFIGAMAGTLAGFLTSGWSSTLVDDQQRFSSPNQGIWLSLRNGLLAGGIFGVVGGIVSGLACDLAFWAAGLTGWFPLGMGCGIVFGILFATRFFAFHGGIACVEHYILRYYLWRRGDIPWNYAAFLQYAKDRILLRRVGGGYIFTHGLLLEHFANRKDASTTERLLE
ncbi:helix-turn-helix domain-containing protein [Ktedonobacter robiniae]|uniref:HTH cro/C1-type domain-containing protein n=1 Tax=Ktedonobacter robiniae TaxID=2778365 RepID=A0ABQ3V221_9CHLR|nr:helix-turn-helix domain-containing protein [Ktedonobacter robiniae]GHO59201.1 hypothetical protein KSB_76760 [Ktedonobacter robiniae]